MKREAFIFAELVDASIARFLGYKMLFFAYNNVLDY